jgi:hypothetical protein
MLLGLVVMRRVSLGLQVEEAVAPLAKVRRLGLAVLVTPVKVRGHVVRYVTFAILAVAGLEKLQRLAGRRGGQSLLSLTPRDRIARTCPFVASISAAVCFSACVQHQPHRQIARK